jgi:hypothetical protein
VPCGAGATRRALGRVARLRGSDRVRRGPSMGLPGKRMFRLLGHYICPGRGLRRHPGPAKRRRGRPRTPYVAARRQSARKPRNPGLGCLPRFVFAPPLFNGPCPRGGYAYRAQALFPRATADRCGQGCDRHGSNADGPQPHRRGDGSRTLYRIPAPDRTVAARLVGMDQPTGCHRPISPSPSPCSSSPAPDLRGLPHLARFLILPMYRPGESGRIPRIDDMDKARKIEIGVGFFVAAALADLLMPPSRVFDLSEVERDDRGYGPTAEFQGIGDIRRLVRRNKAARGWRPSRPRRTLGELQCRRNSITRRNIRPRPPQSHRGPADAPGLPR